MMDEVQVVIRHELTEHLVTTGDIGLPVTSLLHKFPQVCKTHCKSMACWTVADASLCLLVDLSGPFMIWVLTCKSCSCGRQ